MLLIGSNSWLNASTTFAFYRVKAITLRLVVIFFILPLSASVSACSNSTSIGNTKVSVKSAVSGSDLFLPSEELSDPVDLNKYAVRSRIVNVNADLLMSELKTGQVNNLNLNFFTNARFRLMRKKQTINAKSGNITWLGTIPSEPGSIAVLIISPKGIEGSFDAPNAGLFTVRKLSDGSHIVEEIKRSALR